MSTSNTISTDTETSRVVPAAAADNAFRDSLIEDNIDQVQLAAGRMLKRYGHQMSYEDLYSYGLEGLLDAATRFDPTKGATFPTYCFYRIRGAMFDALRRVGWYSRSDVHRYNARVTPRPAANDNDGRTAAPALSEGESFHVTFIEAVRAKDEQSENCPIRDHAVLHLADESTPGPDQVLERGELCEQLRAAVATLPVRERQLIEEHYFSDRDLGEIGAGLGLSKWGTSRLHARAVRLLREAVEQDVAR